MDVFYDALPWHESRLFRHFLSFADTFIALSKSWRHLYAQFIPESDSRSFLTARVEAIPATWRVSPPERRACCLSG